MIEKLGRGTIKIIEDCKDKGLPALVKYWWVTTVAFPGVTVVGSGNLFGDKYFQKFWDN
jgi:hypothetical protein